MQSYVDYLIGQPDAHVNVIHQEQTNQNLFMILEVNSSSATCPTCRKPSSRPHSRYCRRVNDLPYSDLTVQLQILVRKWFCDNSECESRVFTERLSWLKPYQRRTERLEQALEKIALSTNCLTAEKVCRALHIPISHDTLLRKVKKLSFEPGHSPFRRHR